MYIFIYTMYLVYNEIKKILSDMLHTHTYILFLFYIYIYIYIYMCVCVCVCVYNTLFLVKHYEIMLSKMLNIHD